jgi:mRNA interferase RelE/StbE
MPDYTVTFARSAGKELDALAGGTAERVFHAIEKLADNPRPSGVVKLHGFKNLWPIRVGDYRVVFSVDEQKRMVDVAHVRHRKDVYRGL